MRSNNFQHEFNQRSKFNMEYRTIFTQILQKSSETTNSIAAHFEFRSVTVVDSHGEVEISLRMKTTDIRKIISVHRNGNHKLGHNFCANQ
mmetsp:Transcript_24103/g.46093  ORF Transcript_24103/g.46093 Transcript_24103/m.46093 type:complete len:90 (+) Transcript_24103:1109-1378(+)